MTFTSVGKLTDLLNYFVSIFSPLFKAVQLRKSREKVRKGQISLNREKRALVKKITGQTMKIAKKTFVTKVRIFHP